MSSKRNHANSHSHQIFPNLSSTRPPRQPSSPLTQNASNHHPRTIPTTSHTHAWETGLTWSRHHSVLSTDCRTPKELPVHHRPQQQQQWPQFSRHKLKCCGEGGRETPSGDSCMTTIVWYVVLLQQTPPHNDRSVV